MTKYGQVRPSNKMAGLWPSMAEFGRVRLGRTRHVTKIDKKLLKFDVRRIQIFNFKMIRATNALCANS